MKLTLYQDELWPVLFLTEREHRFYPTVEVSEDLYKEYKQAEEAFFAMQDKLEALIDEQNS